MDYQLSDVTDPDQSSFEPGFANCVIDKATLDSVACSSDDGQKVNQMV